MGELERRPNAWALTPLVVFLLTYLVVSIVAGDFYKMPITVAFVISSIVAIAISKGGKLSNRIEQFCRGAANSNIMLMVLIFILAGAFAQTAKAMGAVDATVNLAMSILLHIHLGRYVGGHDRGLGPGSRRYSGQDGDAGRPYAGCRGERRHVRR